MPRLENAPPFRFAHEAPLGEMREVSAQDDDLREINKYAIKPQTRDDVAIFRLDLVNNKVDRHYSRFPERELQRISTMIKGKPLMELHQTSTRQPRGLFFRSQVVIAGQRASGGDPTISVRPDVYIPRIFSNRDFIENINAGVYRGTSIGFQFDYPECSVCGQDMRTCAHMPGSEYEVEKSAGKKSRETCHYVMHDVSDVFEGSIVPVPSQRTEVVEARAFVGLDVPTFDKALQAARDAYRAPIEIQSPEKRQAEIDLLAEYSPLFAQLRAIQRETSN